MARGDREKDRRVALSKNLTYFTVLPWVCSDLS